MINEQIRDKEIRLIGENGEQLGIMSAKEALALAKEAEKAARYAKKDYTPDVYVRYPTDICLKGVTDQAINTKPFLSLLNTLSWCQIQWKFINDNDQINEIPVIEFTDKFNYILNDTVTDDADEIIKILNIKPRITDKNGDIPKGIFSRFFDDKTFIVINLFAEDGEYLIDGKSVFLDKHQVFISADGDIKSEIKTQETNLDFNINYCNDNIIRTMHINSNIKICVILIVKNPTSFFIGFTKI